METKYYTPEFRDFHYGFEYEDGYFNAHFTPKMFDFKDVEGGMKCLFVKALDNKQIRVKYLDREDIESLGWEFIKQHPGTTSCDFELGKFYLSFDPEFGEKWNLRIYDGEYQESELNFFNGYIKNKSELKRIMNQIGISEK